MWVRSRALAAGGFKEMLNTDNLENGLEHSAASVTPSTHSTPQGCSAHVCFDFAPRIGAREEGRGFKGDRVVVLEDFEMHGNG